MAGLEVEDLRPAAPPFHGVVVAEVLEVAKHPNADKLRVCQVNAGGGETLEIVCGAPNVRAGIKVPLARVGAELPPAGEGEDAKPFRIEVGKIRGVESRGMLCSARELKLSEDHGGLLILDDARAGRRRPAPAPAARRHDLHAQAHAQPRPRPQRLRHRPRGRGADRGAAEAAAHRSGAGRRRVGAAGRGRGARPVRALLRAHRPRRRHHREDAGVDGRAPGALRPAHRRAAGRHLELRDVRARPAFAHLRPRHHRRRPHGPLGAAGRDAGAAQRRDRGARRGGRRHRRRQPCRIARRHHGRRPHRGVRRHAQRVCRGGVLVARVGRRALAPLQVLHRRRAPLRARRRPGDDGRAHRAHHRADRRDLRRQRDPLRADRRPRRQPADAGAGDCCASPAPPR